MSEQGQVQLHIRNKIAYVNFYHPASNSFPSNLLAELSNTISKLDQNNEVTLIVLQSEGERAFCAGASFDELLEVDNQQNGEQFFSGFAHVINAMRKSSKIIVGRVQGKAVGGGVGLVSACDYVFATESASVKLSELAIGIGPFVIEPAVSRKIGIPAMSEMTLEAETWKSAQWAKENKLFTQVFSSIAEMDEAVNAFCDRLSAYNPEALQEMKKAMWQGTEHWDELLIERAKISGRLVLSDFTRNALSKFKQK
ncbi:MAG TPA: enoyl-CoA hydratase/isomerase family protein [Flavobacterium sp.]|nr:enoyl-CoA hydratase/isomerase family protein [Flavobacterium sp.]